MCPSGSRDGKEGSAQVRIQEHDREAERGWDLCNLDEKKQKGRSRETEELPV